MIYLGDNPVGVGIGQTNLKLLQTVEFNNTNEQKTLTTQSEWANYDFLLLVPDMTVTPQEGQTKNNWLWMRLTNTNGGSSGVFSTSNYSANGTAGVRDMRDMVTVFKCWNSDRYYWNMMFQTGRGGQAQCVTGHADEETLADLQIIYGGYYQGDYGLFNGTLKIYGGKFME